MRAPSSMSLFSKAYNFLKGKTSPNDEDFYMKPNTFPSEIYPALSEPIYHKGAPSFSRKNRQVLGEISNRSWSVAIDREQKQQCQTKERFSPRAMGNKFWTSREEKKLNNVVQQQPVLANRCLQDQEYDDNEEQGVFKIQLIKHQNGFLGIILVGGSDTPLQNHYVNDILPNSSASKSGRVRAGDQLLEANGEPLGGKTHAEALMIFRSLPAVVELLVARTKDAKRAIIERLKHERSSKQVNNNIASPVERRSVMEEAAKTSVVPRSFASVVDVTKAKSPHVKPVKRVSRVSSFVGTEDNKVAINSTVSAHDDKQKRNQTDQKATNDQDNKIREMGEMFYVPTNADGDAFGVYNDIGESIFDLPQIPEKKTLRYATIKRSRTLNPPLKRRSVIERGDDVSATWPACTTKQRLPLPWDSSTTPWPATVGRISSVHARRSIATTSTSTLTLHQGSSTRKPTSKHYIDKKTLTFEIERVRPSSDWGFTIGGGIFSPYGDLPIFVADISATEGAQVLLMKGDEIVDFSGESFEGITFLEAEKMLRRLTKKKATVTIKRKYLERCQKPQSNPYLRPQTSLNTTKTTPGSKQKRRPKSVHY